MFDGGGHPHPHVRAAARPVVGVAVTVIASLIQGFRLAGRHCGRRHAHYFPRAFFVVVTSLLYRKWHSRGGALASLPSAGHDDRGDDPYESIYYRSVLRLPRAAIASMILPAILPFNAIKVVINLVVIMLIYKPISRLLHNRNWL